MGSPALRAAVGALLCGAALGAGASCGEDMLGTARVLSLARQAAAYGRAQHAPLPLPLAPGEVVITFDDGPRPESTPAVLQTLQAECVRVLLHDAQDQTAAALPLLLRTLKARGYRVVHLDWQ